MGHGHGHGHAGTDARRLTVAMAITTAVLVATAIGAALTGSLALLADLGHQVTDVLALGGAVLAARWAARPPSDRRTFGLGRSEVLGAAANALALLAVTVWVLVEDIERLTGSGGPAVPGLGLLVFGAVGLVGNLISLAVLRPDHDDEHGGGLNRRGAVLHVLGDALGSVAVLVAAAVTMLTGWAQADTAASLVIVAILVPRTVALLREAGHLLLEGAPPGIDVADVDRALRGVPGVDDVHDLHVWAINDRQPAMSAHLVVGEDAVAPAGCGDRGILDGAGAVLRERFGLHHSTLQVEDAAHADHEISCTSPPRSVAY